MIDDDPYAAYPNNLRYLSDHLALSAYEAALRDGCIVTFGACRHENLDDDEIGIGFHLGKVQRWSRPFLVVNLGRRGVTVGWLLTDPAPEPM